MSAGAAPAATLNRTERRAVARIVAQLEADLGEVCWRFGSMARVPAEKPIHRRPTTTAARTSTCFLRDRRRIRSFFFQEVDRDKIVLAGGNLEGEEYR